MTERLRDVLIRNARTAPDELAVEFLPEYGGEPERLTWSELLDAAQLVAARVVAAVPEGERVIILTAPGSAFVRAFWGCVLAARTVVTCFPPDPTRIAASIQLVRSVAQDCQPAGVVCDQPIRAAAQLVTQEIPELPGEDAWINVDDADTNANADGARFDGAGPSGDAPLMLQYSSGSTGTPRGVVLSDACVLANVTALIDRYEVTSSSHVVSWLPPYHDMGLMGGLLTPVLACCPVTNLTPWTFLRRPLSWLEAIDGKRDVKSPAPDFAYALVARRLAGTADVTYDLSGWSVAITGAEPVREATLDAFVAATEPFGFAREALCPAYGLAEATLMATGVAPRTAPTVFHADLEQLRAGRLAPASAGTPSRSLVACGAPAAGHEIRILDLEGGGEVEPGTIGEICVGGPSIADGYWQQPELTTAAFGPHPELPPGRWVRTGDVGAVLDGELVPTGRIKDVLIVHGRNHYPQDVEYEAALAHPAIRPGCVAVFAHEDGDQERIVLVAEVRDDAGAEFEVIERAVRQRIASREDVPLHEVVLIPKGALPKTSSGKVRRRPTALALADGELPTLHHGDPAGWTSRGGRAPRTETERVVADIWRRTLVIEDDISIDDDYFDLGGDSLAAGEIAEAIAEHFAVELDVADLAEFTTIAAVAEEIERQTASSD